MAFKTLIPLFIMNDTILEMLLFTDLMFYVLNYTFEEEVIE